VSRTGLAALLVVILANFAAWAWIGRPVSAPNFDGVIRGVSFSPYQRDNDPAKDNHPSPVEIDRDLRLLEGVTGAVRTYSALDGLDLVPYLARPYGLRVTMGAWLDQRLDRNEEEIHHLVAAARNNHNVDRVILGNEAILRGDLTADQVVGYMKRVRSEVHIPVSTAEPWHVWLAHPELAREADFIAIHVLPYWEGIPADHAVDYVLDHYRQVQAAFPGKHVVLSEVGWPSDGRTRGDAKATPEDEALFLRDFLNAADRYGIDYNVMEAFDQPWKAGQEGAVGAYWGIFNAFREPKFPFSGAIAPLAEWPWLAAAAALLALFPAILFMRRAKALRAPAYGFMPAVMQISAFAVVWAVHLGLARYMGASAAIAWTFGFVAMAVVFAILIAEAVELVEALWRARLARRFPAASPQAMDHLPKVSIHVPCCNEPPDMVIETLNALRRLDYPDFEVLVVDNNTTDPALWLPVQAFCAELGPNFRFFHIDKLKGFKAGALNFALRETDPKATVIGVIDSDYAVEPGWLRSLVPYFASEQVGFVQAPQDYRDAQESNFKKACFWEYAGFFHIGMVERNERNAIIEHGTMTLIRRAALERLGGWAEWCICEDAELGLRLLEAGCESIYVAHSFGRGLMPDSFSAYKGQRFRWAYGAVQIAKRHWRALFAGNSRLTPGQRFHFLAGWLPWLADGLNVVFTLLAVPWSLGLAFWPRLIDFPPSVVVAAALGLFGFKLTKTLWLYRARVPASWSESLKATLAGLSLSFAVGRAVLKGLVTSKQPFLRTPKCEDRPAWQAALATAWQETAIMAALWMAAISIGAVYGVDTLDVRLWIAFLLVQSVPLAAALGFAALSAAPARKPVIAPVPGPAAGPVLGPMMGPAALPVPAVSSTQAPANPV
jgi:exo-beta-1,3-glucanase (GH17 family)/cellulose synthase/poly-beta-1,6-N-acetylglucosamine synthase-like glycosyltransferase